MKANISKGTLWTSRIMSGIVILFMLFDSIMKLVKPAPVVEGTLVLGFAEHHIAVIGILGLISTILYAIPRTSFLGALLLTGYFGGVIATHVRMDAPLFTHVLFPVYIAILAWGGIWLRDGRVRSLFPIQSRELDR
ncbi:DoxX family protein [Paenibacillus sp. NPDC056579]|uniref:DoxX family protein n=1 Tax=unclassified Paenibacillus TaxID=185978 RepID=UPI001EF8D77F|nr:DoxX family protein [Paenibacillus sp. H1-7]ULL15929.1 DoxX family protein [Paenibacillus sp. H1-7]